MDTHAITSRPWILPGRAVGKIEGSARSIDLEYHIISPIQSAFNGSAAYFGPSIPKSLT